MWKVVRVESTAEAYGLRVLMEQALAAYWTSVTDGDASERFHTGRECACVSGVLVVYEYCRKEIMKQKGST